ncbi:hypothetical protein ACFX2J_045952 [Malus domestica]
MATTSKRVKTIMPAIQLKQVMKLWKAISLNGKSSPAPSGFLPVYIGWNRTRFLIPTHYLNFPIFAALLRKSGEEFGFKANGGIVLPCDVEFFKEVLNLLRKDEKRYGSLEVPEFLKMVSEVRNFDYSYTMCSKEDSDSCDHHQGYLRPLLQKARA